MKKSKLPNGLECYYLSQRETEYIYSEVFLEQQYTQHNIVVNEGDCIFDVGANIGLFILFLNQIQQNLKIYSFEPIEQTFTVLSGNVNLHNLSNVYLFNYGLSSENDAERPFTFYPNMPGNSTDRPNDKVAQRNVMGDLIGLEQTDHFFQSTPVVGEVRTLSRVIKDLSVDSIDLLKIDVEGEELAVIQGINQSDWIKVKQIVAEVHDVENRLEKFLLILKKQGFKIHAQKNPLLPDMLQTYNVYAVR